MSLYYKKKRPLFVSVINSISAGRMESQRVRKTFLEPEYHYEKESETSSDDSSYTEHTNDSQSLVSQSDSEDDESELIDVFSKSTEEDEEELLQSLVVRQKELRRKEKKRQSSEDDKQVRKRLDFDHLEEEEEIERPAKKLKKDTVKA